MLSQAKKGYYMVEGVLYFDGADMPDRRRLVVPKHLGSKYWRNIMMHLMQVTLLQRE